MNIYELRNCMHVTIYACHAGGCSISYIRGNSTSSLTLNKEQMIDELIHIGSLDEEVEYEKAIGYKLSQWDALNIAIRFEAARDQEKEIENSDIGAAFDKILGNKYDK